MQSWWHGTRLPVSFSYPIEDLVGRPVLCRPWTYLTRRSGPRKYHQQYG